MSYKCRLLVYEQRMSSHFEKEQALQAIHESPYGGRGQGCGSFRGRGSGRQKFDKATVECYYCYKLGHFQYKYFKLKKEANYVKANEEMLLMTYVNCQNANRESVWFLDSGYSNHMCGKKRNFL